MNDIVAAVVALRGQVVFPLLQAAAAEDIDDIRKRMREADHKERDGKKAKQ
jgi:hypothetical protein